MMIFLSDGHALCVLHQSSVYTPRPMRLDVTSREARVCVGQVPGAQAGVCLCVTLGSLHVPLALYVEDMCETTQTRRHLAYKFTCFSIIL